MPAEAPHPRHAVAPRDMQAYGFGLNFYRLTGGSQTAGRTTLKGAAYVWVIKDHWFLASKSLALILSLTRGDRLVHAECVPHIFQVRRPLVSINASVFFRDLPIWPADGSPLVKVEGCRYPLMWTLPHLYRAVIDMGAPHMFEVTMPRRQRPTREGPGGGANGGEEPDGAEEADEGEEGDDGDGGVVEDLLAAMLEELPIADDGGGLGGDDLGGPEELDLDNDGHEREEDPVPPPEPSEGSSDVSEEEEEAAPALSAEVRARVLHVVNEGCAQLADARRIKDERAAKPILKATISLVAWRNEITFVRWTEPENKREFRPT